MSKNTVKPALTPKPRKRAKRQVETNQFDAFARRILRAYARRVAAGDVEALSALVTLSVEVDAVTREAVAGLRAKPYAYSWSEIADRLGVSRQAVQMRYGDRADRGALDQRILDAGLGVSVATLVAVFADHHPGNPPASLCPACGYRYPEKVTDCPTLTTIRPVLYRRRGEDEASVNQLSAIQYADLLSHKAARANRAAARQLGVTTPAGYRPAALFDLTGSGAGIGGNP
jgi:DNA-binding Lrp family transcriptional regulator